MHFNHIHHLLSFHPPILCLLSPASSCFLRRPLPTLMLFIPFLPSLFPFQFYLIIFLCKALHRYSQWCWCSCVQWLHHFHRTVPSEPSFSSHISFVMFPVPWMGWHRYSVGESHHFFLTLWLILGHFNTKLCFGWMWPRVSRNSSAREFYDVRT